MKRAILAAIAALTFACLLAGCSSTPASSKANSSASSAASTNVRVASLKGPTSIGIAQFMDEASNGKTTNSYDFAVSGTADEVLPKIIQGDVDIALIPANAAATVYAKTNGAISVIDVNTLGVLYVVSGDGSLAKIEDLAGKTVYMTGKGTTPEYVMNYLLSQAGIADQVTLEFKSEASEVAATLNADANAIGVLPEPYVTSTQLKNPALAPRISLTEAWNNLQKESGSQLVTGVTVVRNEFATAHPEAVKEFIEKQRASVEYALAQPQAAGELVVKAGIMDNAKAAASAIPRCNLTCLTGAQMKTALSGYLQVLFDQNPSSVGGSMPSNSFYYGA